jgi:integrase
MQKFSIKPVLWDYKKNTSEVYTVKLMVTVDRKATYIKTPYRVHKNQFDKEKRAVISHANAAIINVDLRRKIADLEKELITTTMLGVSLSKRVIKGEVKTARNFYEFAKEVRYDETEINRIKAYAGDQLLLSDVTVSFLRKFEAHERKRGMMQNTLNSTFKYLGRIIRQAKKEKLIQENSFEEFEIPKYKQTDRTYLVEEELKLLINKLDELPHNLYLIACYFLLGCYTGLRHSDWRRFDLKMVEDGFIKIRAKKNGVHVVLPIGITLRSILERVKTLEKPPTLEECNRQLKAIALIVGIKKKLSTHAGRHSAGYMFASNGLPESVAASLLGVSASTIKVYYHLTGNNILKHAEVLKHI